MNRLSTVLAAVVIVIALAVGWIVAGEIDGIDPDEVCASAHSQGWTYFETENDDGFYCQAPNGSVHRTIVHLSGPTYSWDHLKLVGLILMLTAFVGVALRPWADRGQPEEQ